MPSEEFNKIYESMEVLFEEILKYQQFKVLQVARSRVPHLTGDDILNPHDFPQLAHDPIFNYEEGMAAGLMAAQIAMRRHFKTLLSPEETHAR